MFKPLNAQASPAKALVSAPSEWRDLPAQLDAAGIAVAVDLECDRTIPDRVVSSRDVAGLPTELRRELTGAERTKLQGRVAALTETLAPYSPADEPKVDAELSAMLFGFRSYRQQGDDGGASVEIAKRVLAEFPFWAIAKACKLIATGQATIDGEPINRTFAPSDAEIHRIVAGIVAPYRATQGKTLALLNALVAKPEPQRPTSEEIEARLGRKIERHVKPDQHHSAPARPGYMERVMADLERRKREREAQTESTSTGPPSTSAA